MHLRGGVTAQQAIKVIEEQISASQRSLTSAGDDADLKRNLYLNWVADTEIRLQEGFLRCRDCESTSGTWLLAHLFAVGV